MFSMNTFSGKLQSNCSELFPIVRRSRERRIVLVVKMKISELKWRHIGEFVPQEKVSRLNTCKIVIASEVKEKKKQVTLIAHPEVQVNVLCNDTCDCDVSDNHLCPLDHDAFHMLFHKSFVYRPSTIRLRRED